MRLITRADFDGLISGVLLREAGIVKEFVYAHPKDVQDGKVKVTANDVLANVPYVPGCGIWFDHHLSEEERKAFPHDFKGRSLPAKSCARIIYDYFGGREKFPHFDEMLTAVDKTDSGDLAADEVSDPKGWLMLAVIMDPRTGLGRYTDYRISNLQLMEDLMERCRTTTIEELLELPDIAERVKRYRQDQESFTAMIKSNAKVFGNVLAIDLRKADHIYAGNRFLEYTLFPQQNVSIRAMWGLKKQNVAFAVGYSIINRSCHANIGVLLLKYGGGGHRQVGTCQVPAEIADQTMDEIILQLKAEG